MADKRKGDAHDLPAFKKRYHAEAMRRRGTAAMEVTHFRRDALKAIPRDAFLKQTSLRRTERLTEPVSYLVRVDAFFMDRTNL